MKMKIALALILVLILSFSGFAFAKDTNDQFQQEHVIIDLKLKVPELVPQAVQLAIFYTDPVSAFKNYMSVQSPSIDRQAALEVSWDLCFRDITGNNLYLITMEPKIYSQDKEGKIWVATKSVTIAKRSVCWCMPLTVKRGERYQVLLSPKNQIDLEEYYYKLTKK